MVMRCQWGEDAAMIAYHDQEWGVPSHADRHLFEMLILEGAQAGLSWATILKKRAAYQAAFAGFDPAVVAGFGEAELVALLGNAGIVRNRLKLRAAVANAQGVLRIQEEYGSFDRFLWQFVGGQPIRNAWASQRDVPARTAESDAMSKALRKLGFGFVGSTICYALMQAAGLVNDHVTSCFRWGEVAGEKAGDLV